jgi:predicted nucleic acid-binding protein
VTLVVDASVGLKWVLKEADSHLAEALLRHETDLRMPDFWLHEATNVLWLQVRRHRLAPEEAREALTLLRHLIEPTPTSALDLHEAALDIGIAANHSTYDTMYLAFTIAIGARGLVVADAPFVRDMKTRPDFAALIIPLDEWGRSAALSE